MYKPREEQLRTAVVPSPPAAPTANYATIAWLLAVLTTLAYALIPTRNYYWDGIEFAQTIEDAQKRGWPLLFHPNHLLYNVVGYAAWRLAGNVRALYVLQALNAVFGGCATLLIFRILARFRTGIGTAVILSLFFAFSGTWWRFATNSDAYILAVLLLLVSFWILVRTERPNAAVAGAAYASAMLIHELSLLFFPVAALALWYGFESAPRERLRAIVRFCFVAVGCTVAAYLSAYRSLHWNQSVASVAAWIFRHREDTFTTSERVAGSIRSWLQLIFSGRPSLVNVRAPGNLLLITLAAASLVLLGAALWKLSRSTTVRIVQPRLFRLALVWLASYAVFEFFWMPAMAFYKLFALPGLILMIGSVSLDPQPRRLRPGLFFVIFMILGNLVLAAIPYSKVTASPAAAFALDLRRSFEPNALIFYRDFDTDNWFVRYFNPQTSWKEISSTAAVDADLRSRESVWLDTTALDYFSASAPQWLTERIATDKRALIDTGHRIVFQRLTLPPPH